MERLRLAGILTTLLFSVNKAVLAPAKLLWMSTFPPLVFKNVTGLLMEYPEPVEMVPGVVKVMVLEASVELFSKVIAVVSVVEPSTV